MCVSLRDSINICGLAVDGVETESSRNLQFVVLALLDNKCAGSSMCKAEVLHRTNLICLIAY